MAIEGAHLAASNHTGGNTRKSTQPFVAVPGSNLYRTSSFNPDGELNGPNSATARPGASEARLPDVAPIAVPLSVSVVFFVSTDTDRVAAAPVGPAPTTSMVARK